MPSQASLEESETDSKVGIKAETPKIGKSLGGRPEKPALKWTVHLAAKEFALGDEGVKKKLAENGIRPGPDGFFSTLEITTALYGGLAREKLLRTRAQRQNEELKYQKQAGELLRVDAVARAWESIIVETKSRLYKMCNTLPGRLSICRNEAELEKTLRDSLDEALTSLTDARIETEPDTPEPEIEGAGEVEPVAESEEAD